MVMEPSPCRCLAMVGAPPLFLPAVPSRSNRTAPPRTTASLAATLSIRKIWPFSSPSPCKVQAMLHINKGLVLVFLSPSLPLQPNFGPHHRSSHIFRESSLPWSPNRPLLPFFPFAVAASAAVRRFCLVPSLCSCTGLEGSTPIDMCVEAAMEKGEERGEKSGSGSVPAVPSSAHLESICENTVAVDIKHKDLDDNQKQILNFVPMIRSGEWSDIGSREYMEDTHVCIADLAKKYGYNSLDGHAVSFYGVFDGHGGKGAAHFVRDNLPRVIVEDATFPLELEKVVTRSFMETDSQFAQTCSLQSALSSGTTALTAMIFGRSLLVANAGDCRAVLSRIGMAIEMSKDHRPCCVRERRRIESLGGYIDDGYLNGQLGVTRALGDWHLEGMKMIGGGPLSAEPELKMITLTRDDEFLIIGSDGLWDVFSSQNAVDFGRRRLQEHNDAKMCCRELVEEAIKRGAADNLTALIVCFQSDPPKQVAHRSRVRRCISAEGLQSLRCLLETRNGTEKEQLI